MQANKKMHVAVALVPLLGAGCSVVLDDAGPDLPLVGEAPPLPPVRVRIGSLDRVELMRDPGGDWWAAVLPASGGGDFGPVPPSPMVRLARLEPPAAEVTLTASRIEIARDQLFLFNGIGLDQPSTLTVQAPGAAGGTPFALPSSDGTLVVGGDGASFAYRPLSAMGTGAWLLFRSDGSASRTLPPPPGPNGSWLDGFFDGAGDRFFTAQHCDTATMPPGGSPIVDSCQRLVAHGLDGSDVDLGPLPGRVDLDDGDRALVSCGPGGLALVPWDGSAPRTLDGAPCDQLVRTDGESGLAHRAIYYFAQPAGPGAQSLEVVSLDGGGPPRVLLDDPQPGAVLALSPTAVAWSPAGGTHYDSADPGWLGGWQFMERGRDVQIATDGTRVRWLEHTAKLYPSGDLLEAAIATQGPSRRLARNVDEYDELPDGRLLAAANQADTGPQNRVVAIDAARTHARRVADGASWYFRLPDSSDLVVELYDGASDASGDSGWQLARITVPEE